MKLKTFIEKSNLSENLIRAVVRQMGGWKSFAESAPDICKGGIDGGFHGFVYNSETESFARRNRADIAKMASEQANEFGIGIFEMIRGFGCFRHDATKPSDEEIGSALYAGKDVNDANVLNALAWYAGEEVSRSFDDLNNE